MLSWYAVQTRPHSEEVAYCHLQRQGFGPYLPRIQKQVRHARRNQTAIRPLFPGYLFVHLDAQACRWRAVNSTMGVSRLLTDGTAPVVVPPAVICSIQSREDPLGLVALSPTWRSGDPIHLAEGPFRDVCALFDGIDEKQRLMVLLDILGRRISVSLPLEWVET